MSRDSPQTCVDHDSWNFVRIADEFSELNITNNLKNDTNHPDDHTNDLENPNGVFRIRVSEDLNGGCNQKCAGSTLEHKVFVPGN